MAKILIIEDDARTAQYVAQHLGSAGHQCVVEPSGQKAIEVAKHDTHDLIILDNMLPGTSGFEVCRRLRRDTDVYTIPILMLSAMSSEEEVLHGLAQGADDYVIKPFNINNLMQRVEALLRASTDGHGIDDLTTLPKADSTKREIQRRISLQDSFALAYAELLHIREFTYRADTEARTKAIRHLGRALVKCGTKIEDADIFVGHMGSGHFVCVMPKDKAEEYCRYVCKVWQQHRISLYESVGMTAALKGDTGDDRPAVPPLDVLFSVTTRDARSAATPHNLFEVLTQIRHKALEAQSGGVHMDRRAQV
jgi:DNA-binding response OmpR family regulator